MKGYCSELHKLFSQLKRHCFPFREDEIPRDGIYVLFEEGEKGHGRDRIVRVGTHTGGGNLRGRLTEHFMTPNKDRSIFRKNVGRAHLNKKKDPFLVQWNWDLTKTADKKKYGPKLDREKQVKTEKWVTNHIQNRLSFVVLPVSAKAQRLALEAALIGEVSSCEDCGPSSSWLGKHSPHSKIEESGLWQIQKVYGKGLTSKEMEELRRIVKVELHVSAAKRSIRQPSV